MPTNFNENNVIKNLTSQWDTKVLSYFHDRVRQKIQEQVVKGNNQFSVNVDGRASSYDRINQARTVVKVQFTAVALKLALHIARDILSETIDQTTVARTGRLGNNISIYLSRGGKSFTLVPNIDEFEFVVGDVLAYTPIMPYSAVVNRHVTRANSRARTARLGKTKLKSLKSGRQVGGQDRRGQGFMGMAAKQINSRLKQGPGLGGISVTAGFSVALAQAAGVRVYGKPENVHGLPAIFITLRYLTKSSVLNV